MGDNTNINPKELYYWIKILVLAVGGVYLAGKALGEFAYYVGWEF
jgi:hypothetical protein